MTNTIIRRHLKRTLFHFSGSVNLVSMDQSSNGYQAFKDKRKFHWACVTYEPLMTRKADSQRCPRQLKNFRLHVDILNIREPTQSVPVYLLNLCTFSSYVDYNPLFFSSLEPSLPTHLDHIDTGTKKITAIIIPGIHCGRNIWGILHNDLVPSLDSSAFFVSQPLHLIDLCLRL